MELIKAYKTKITIEGLEKDATVAIECEADEVDLTHWDADLAKEATRGLRDGSLESYWVRVTVRFSGLDHFEGVDSLGQVIVSTRNAQKEILEIVQDHDMVQIATQDLIQNVQTGVESIKTFLEVSK